MFSLKLLGGASIEGGEGPLSGRAAQRHRLALLALLVVQRERGQSREKLVAYLWPESDAERARHALSDSIYRLNKVLGGDAVLAVGTELRLNPDLVASDVNEFREAIEAEDWEAAVRAYAGPFLDGFFLPGSVEFERWVDAERDRLGREYAKVLEALAEERAARGDLTGAVGAWRRLAAEDPYDARIAVGLMEALEAAGNRAGALQHARIHEQLLEQEFGVEPDPAVAALAERLRSEPVQAEGAAAAREQTKRRGQSGDGRGDEQGGTSAASRAQPSGLHTPAAPEGSSVEASVSERASNRDAQAEPHTGAGVDEGDPGQAAEMDGVTRPHPLGLETPTAPAAPEGSSVQAGVSERAPMADGGELSGRVVPAPAERRQAVIVASTIAGYVALVERLVPEDAQRVVARIRNRAAEIVTRYGGLVHRLDADEMILVFGVPATGEDDAIRAVRSALELHAEIPRAASAVHPVGDAVALHTGIHTGIVVAQPTGEDTRDYEIAGTSARVASRLAMQAPEDEVWLSPECCRLVEAIFEVEPRGALPVRDRERPLVPFRVVRESGTSNRLEAARRARLTEFAGRDAELSELHRCFTMATDGRGRLAAVIGDAGMGKSRLLHEFRAGLDGAHALVLQGRCQSYGRDTAYLPFIQMLMGWFGLGEIESRAARLEAVVAAVREMSLELEEFMPLYLHLLSIENDRYPLPKHLHGDQFRLAMQDALAAICTLGARQRPAVLLLEDWHWADEASHAVLRQIAELVADHALLVIVSYRPGYGVVWDGDLDVTTTIPLRPLDLYSCEAMLKSLLQVDTLPDELGRLLHEQTGGNPFFLEEICQTLREDGTVRVQGSTASLARSVYALELPDTVQAVIRARLDRLDGDAGAVLRVAAVIGRECSRSLLERTLPDASRLPRALEALKAAGLIQQRRIVPEPAYRFKHVLTQEVAYASLLEHQRRQLHARVGEALEQLCGENLDTEADRLAHHFSRAEEWPKAVHYGLRAAERASALAQFTEALRRLERTRRWLDELPDDDARRENRIEILLRQERLCETLGLRGRQQRIIDELVQLLEPNRDGPKLAEVYVRQGDLFTLLGRFDEADAALARSLSVYRELEDEVGERNGLRSLGLLRWHEGRNQEALDAIEQALAIDRRRADLEAIIGDLANLGSVLKSLGELDRAQACLEEALQLLERDGSDALRPSRGVPLLKQSYILHHLANVHRELGDSQRALEYLERAGALSRAKRLPIQASFHDTAIAHMLLREGRIEDSLRYYRQATELTRRANYVPGLAQALRILGTVLSGLGREEEALPMLEEAGQLFAQLKDEAAEALIWSEVAGVHEHGGRHAEALAAWSKARSLRRQRNDTAAELEAVEGIARVARRHVAEPSLALGYYLEALALAQRVEDIAGEAKLRNSIAILLWEQGDYAEALEHYAGALEIFRRFGDDVHAGLMLASIGATLKAMNRWHEALVPLEEAIALHRRTGQPQLEAYALGTLGEAHLELGAVDAARSAFEASLAVRREIGDRLGEGWMLYHIARANLARGSAEEVREWIARAHEIAVEIGDKELVTACEQTRREPSH